MAGKFSIWSRIGLLFLGTAIRGWVVEITSSDTRTAALSAWVLELGVYLELKVNHLLCYVLLDSAELVELLPI